MKEIQKNSFTWIAKAKKLFCDGRKEKCIR